VRTLGLFEILIIALVILLLFGGPRLPRMAGWLGRRVRTTTDQIKWVYQSMGGSEEEEIRAEQPVGERLAKELQEQMPPDPDPGARNLVARLGERLTKTESAGKRPFHFQVIAGPAANAYALPGGFVFITRQLLDLCADEDEAAFVLAHEMGHVLSKHFVGKYTMDFVLSRIKAGQLIGELLGKGYSREQEHEADSKGLALAAEAGFNPSGAHRFLQKLDTFPRNTSILAEYFSTHPTPVERITQLRNQPAAG
jgi:predicted Zn-dependent protease